MTLASVDVIIGSALDAPLVKLIYFNQPDSAIAAFFWVEVAMKGRRRLYLA
jgi:hypothetical protein